MDRLEQFNAWLVEIKAELEQLRASEGELERDLANSERRVEEEREALLELRDLERQAFGREPVPHAIAGRLNRADEPLREAQRAAAGPRESLKLVRYKIEDRTDALASIAKLIAAERQRQSPQPAAIAEAEEIPAPEVDDAMPKRRRIMRATA